MDSHTLEVLEYPRIISRLADCCACSLGKRGAERLRPRNEADWVAERLAETGQARIVLKVDDIARGEQALAALADGRV